MSGDKNQLGMQIFSHTVPRNHVLPLFSALFLMYKHETIWCNMVLCGGVKKELNKFLCTKGETPGGDTSCYVHSVTPGLCAVWNAVMLSKIALWGSNIFSFV